MYMPTNVWKGSWELLENLRAVQKTVSWTRWIILVVKTVLEMLKVAGARWAHFPPNLLMVRLSTVRIEDKSARKNCSLSPQRSDVLPQTLRLNKKKRI
jgi:hypothetical protein